MEELISVESSGGVIEAYPLRGTDYPAIQIEINGVVAGLIEYDEYEKCFKVHAYYIDQEEPYSIRWEKER
jgi:hypothetical protein